MGFRDSRTQGLRVLGLCELRVLRGFKNLGVQGLKNFRVFGFELKVRSSGFRV